MSARWVRVGGVIIGALMTTYATEGSAQPLQVEHWTTVATAARPEVHLLLRNSGSSPIEFTLELAGVRGGAKLRCADTNTAQPDFLSRFHHWNGVSFGDSRGVVPAHGWAHRSIVLGEFGAVPPCEVPYRLRVDGEATSVIEGVVTVPVAGMPARGEVHTGEISWSAMVERHRLYPRRLVARVAVKNETEHGIVLQLDRRVLSCAGTARASWAEHSGVVQGQDVGPLDVAGKHWGVFVASVDVWDVDDPARCTVSADLVVDTERGLQKYDRVEFSLSPHGFLDAATKGRR